MTDQLRHNAQDPPQPIAGGIEDDDGMSLAQRRPHRLNRRMPLHFRDMVPEPLMPLPPSGVTSTVQPMSMPTPASDSAPRPAPVSGPPSTSVMEGLIDSVPSSIRHIFRTQNNKFGLYRVYYAESIPSHDPDDPFSIANECVDGNAPEERCPGVLENPFHLYPNENSMRLGDWYWNQGAQKSKESFRELLAIVGSECFHPGEVAKTNWQAVDKTLGQNQFDIQPDSGDWLDEDDGWRRTAVPISVPFHSRFQEPGPKIYHIRNFYHRSLTSIIRERLSDPSYSSHFHCEPYELHWHPPHKEHDVRVYGELYTSGAFIEAHQQLQGSPPEPGCDLPRVVAGIMFWSDSTHLTSFGHAKLWPLYLYFGNESKYRWCQPSCHLCCHAVYFQTASIHLS